MTPNLAVFHGSWLALLVIVVVSAIVIGVYQLWSRRRG
jgi:hypothetical protein